MLLSDGWPGHAEINGPEEMVLKKLRSFFLQHDQWKS